MDLSTAGLSISSDRTEVMDFSIGLYEDQLTIMQAINYENKAFNVMAYLHIFDLYSWLTCGVIVALLALCFALISWTNIEQFHDANDSEHFGYLNGIALVVIAVIQRDYCIKVANNSSRLLFNVTCIFGFLIFAYYNAVLTSLMTSDPQMTSIDSFRDIYENNIRIFTWGGTSASTAFKNSKPGSYMKMVYDRMIAEDPNNFELYSMSLIMKRVLANPSNVYFGSTVASVGDSRIHIRQIEETITSQSALGFPSNSEIQPLFNFHLQQMYDTGLLKVLCTRWTTEGVDSLEAVQEQQASILDYNNLFFPFAIVVGGGAVSVILLILEWFHKRMRITRNNISSRSVGRPRTKSMLVHMRMQRKILGRSAAPYST